MDAPSVPAGLKRHLNVGKSNGASWSLKVARRTGYLESSWGVNRHRIDRFTLCQLPDSRYSITWLYYTRHNCESNLLDELTVERNWTARIYSKMHIIRINF